MIVVVKYPVSESFQVIGRVRVFRSFAGPPLDPTLVCKDSLFSWDDTCARGPVNFSRKKVKALCSTKICP